MHKFGNWFVLGTKRLRRFATPPIVGPEALNTLDSRSRAHGLRRPRVLGFTLIELLVVLLVMGLLAGLVSAIGSPDKRGVLRLEAERLARLLDLAEAQSRLSGKSIAWTADAAQYRFWQFARDSGWSEIRDSELFRARTLPQGIVIKNLQIENTSPRATMRLEFAPYGPVRSFHMVVSLGLEQYVVAASPIGEIRATPTLGKGE